MTKIKEQLQNVLSEQQRFTEKNEQAVLARLQKKKRSLNIPIIACCFTVLAVIFIVLTTSPSDSPTTATEASLLAYLNEQAAGQDVEILYQKLNVVEKQDALIVYQLSNNKEMIKTEYVQFKDKKYQQVHKIDLPIETPYLWQATNNAPYLTAGIMIKHNVKQVFVGEKKAQLVDLDDGWLYWVQFSNELANRVVVEYKNGKLERLEGYGEQSTHSIPYVSFTSDTESTMTYLSDTMDRGRHDYSAYPVVVDEQLAKLERKDVIFYENDQGQTVMSRVLGLPGERFAIQNGTVIIEEIPFHEDSGFAKIGGETVFEVYKEKMGNHLANEAAAKSIFYYELPEVVLQENEVVVVPDNWMRGAIEVISPTDIKGKVLGYEAGAVAKNIWTATERDLYEAFKTSNDLELLRDETPITIARIYKYASFLNDQKSEYQLLTTRENHVVWSEEEHLQVKPAFEELAAREQAIQISPHLLEGEFIQTDEVSGYIAFSDGEQEQGFQMILNEQGIWQVAFMPLQ